MADEEKKRPFTQITLSIVPKPATDVRKEEKDAPEIPDPSVLRLVDPPPLPLSTEETKDDDDDGGRDEGCSCSTEHTDEEEEEDDADEDDNKEEEEKEQEDWPAGMKKGCGCSSDDQRDPRRRRIQSFEDYCFKLAIGEDTSYRRLLVFLGALFPGESGFPCDLDLRDWNGTEEDVKTLFQQLSASIYSWKCEKRKSTWHFWFRGGGDQEYKDMRAYVYKTLGFVDSLERCVAILYYWGGVNAAFDLFDDGGEWGFAGMDVLYTAWGRVPSDRWKDKDNKDATLLNKLPWIDALAALKEKWRVETGGYKRLSSDKRSAYTDDIRLPDPDMLRADPWYYHSDADKDNDDDDDEEEEGEPVKVSKSDE